MRCALAAAGFINGDVEHNLSVMTGLMKEYAGRADVLVLGEAFLQGFYWATFDPEHDAALAMEPDSPAIRTVCRAAKEFGIAASFGLIEKDGENFYSSQYTVDETGALLDVFRRVSPGWKLPHAGERYREGTGFHLLRYMDRSIAVGLCGDLWFDENIAAIRGLRPDVTFWPVYTDFSAHHWNTAMKLEYAEQAGKIGGKVLYVNSLCLDKVGEEIAKGGAVLFENGKIIREIPSGRAGVLLVDV